MRQLAALPRLKSLNLRRCPLNYQSLEYQARLAQLRELELTNGLSDLVLQELRTRLLCCRIDLLTVRELKDE